MIIPNNFKKKVTNNFPIGEPQDISIVYDLVNTIYPSSE